MKSTNRYRALRCRRALLRYDTDFDLTGCLIDLLTDARHWCDHNGHSYVELDRKASRHFREELAAASQEAP